MEVVCCYGVYEYNVRAQTPRAYSPGSRRDVTLLKQDSLQHFLVTRAERAWVG